MFKNFLFLMTTIFIFSACGEEPKSAEQVVEEKATDQIFGEELTSNDALTFTDLLNKMDQLDSMETKVTGTVESVCKKKGCWVNIVSDDGREMLKIKNMVIHFPGNT